MITNFWHEWRGNKDGTRIVMLIRNVFSWRGYKLDLHRFVGYDAKGCFHTHPATAIRFVLWGWYCEELEDGTLKTWRMFRFGIVRPELSHRVCGVRIGGAVTLWFRFPKTHEVELRGTGWEEQ